MTYKTILLVVGISQLEDDLRAAADLCASEGAHLSVLVSKIATLPPMGDLAAISAAWIDSRDGDMEQLRQSVREAREILGSAGLSYDVVGRYSETMRLGQDVGERAWYADVTLVGTSLRVDDLLRRGVIEGALFYSARPVLLAANLRSVTLEPKNVLLAWNSTIESARAARESLDMMQNAEGVHLVLVDPKTKNGEEPGADVATYLAPHGVKVAVDQLASAGRRVEEVLAQHARDTSADLTVIGAYGHSRIRERVFGGATKSMIDAPMLPVLMVR
ncbi:universal stress protein [Sinorhizobium meliloti]|nr:universal stress protein [Sinorhizobium meliloti]MDE3822879.1 universal stress protein [Sinorhizobium meliloti]QND30304.1 universal stress protein [Sinorhizobium meliloti]RVE95334.1 universal stress protein [Sinorhizobium meliloti]RVG00510.1 universal stress protein [Sinorhizobium meliloti]RVG54198.1 universal stress protein [Sinorhizobium meliloti]